MSYQNRPRRCFSVRRQSRRRIDSQNQGRPRRRAVSRMLVQVRDGASDCARGGSAQPSSKHRVHNYMRLANIVPDALPVFFTIHAFKLAASVNPFLKIRGSVTTYVLFFSKQNYARCQFFLAQMASPDKAVAAVVAFSA